MALLTAVLVLVALMDMRDLMAARADKACKAGRADVALAQSLRKDWDSKGFKGAMWLSDRHSSARNGRYWLRLAGGALLAR